MNPIFNISWRYGTRLVQGGKNLSIFASSIFRNSPSTAASSASATATAGSTYTTAAAAATSTDLVSTLLELEKIVGAENFSQAESVRDHHKCDESHHRLKAALPAAVIFPRSTDQVSKCVSLCNQHGITVIPYGTGTGMEGGVAPIQPGSVCFNLTKMDSVLSASAEDFTAVVQPGVTRKGINHYLKDLGVWFPIDPGADASLCGMAATNASGTNAVRYGTMRENVLNLEVVLADGSVFHTAGQGLSCRKTSAGYNLTNLFVGSEGTLGLITQATIRLYGMPEAMISAVCQFDDVKSAVETTVSVLQACIPVARIEFLDEVQMRGCIGYSQLTGYKELPTLFLEFHGSTQSVEEQVRAVSDIASANRGSAFMWAKDAEERNKLWTARHNAFYACLFLKPGGKGYVTDVAVPLSRLTEIITITKEEITASGLLGPIVGHVGDGNFHSMLLFDPNNLEETNKAKELADKMAERAISMGGTCTGEHGVGLGKRHLVAKQRGPIAIEAMKSVKKIFDPKGIMNPGKVF